jgi:hypothetical protein
MKHRIVHTLQKYFLNPPIKLALAVGLLLAGCVARNKREEDGEGTAHSGRGWSYRKPVLASGRARHEGGIRPQH